MAESTKQSESKTKKPRARTKRAPRLLIEVLQHHINDAVPRDSGHCMIAEAIRESVPGAASVSVDMQTVRFSDPARRLRYIYLTPRAAQEALINWDDGVKPTPFEVRLQGAHVISMRAHNPVRTGGASPGARLRPSGSGGTAVPEVRGGSEPPRSNFGRIRAYGLRGLKR